MTDPTGRFVQHGYDLAGRVATTVAGDAAGYAGPATTTGYDLAGRPTTSTDCAVTAQGGCATVLRTRSFTHDAAGRVTQATSAEGRATLYGYDSAGQLATITQRADPGAPATAVTVALGYDRAGRRSRIVDANANPTDFTHTPWGLPETVVEPATTAHPALAERTFTTVYDAAGRPVEERLPGGATRARVFDNLGRLVAETGAGAEVATTARALDHDPLGRVTFAASPAGDHTYTWTHRGQLATATGHGGGATYTYDADNQLTARTDPAGQATFGHDGAGRLTSVVDPLTATTASHTYDGAGRLAATTHGTGNATRAYTYDPLGRLATDTWRRPDTSVAASTTYTYDDDDLLTAKTTTGPAGAGAHLYHHDGLARLTTWTSPAGTTTSYGYDPASNRTTVSTPAGARTTAYDARNRPLGTTGAGQPAQTYTHTARGTLATATATATATTNYTFDAFERLTQVVKTGGHTVAYTYDSHDRPAQRNSIAFGYHDLTNNPVITPAAAGETHLLRDPTGTALAAQTGTDPATTLLGEPAHADITAAADPATGDLAASATLDPWGQTTAATATLPLGLQGGWADPDTGLLNAHARWYDPALGVFTSRDTHTVNPDPVAAANRYLYAHASPLRHTDPTGHVVQPGEGGRPPPPKPIPPTRTGHLACGTTVCAPPPPRPTPPPPPTRGGTGGDHCSLKPKGCRPAEAPPRTFLHNLNDFVTGVQDGWDNWGTDTAEGLAALIDDPSGSIHAMSLRAHEWQDSYDAHSGYDSGSNATVGWMCVLTGACQIYRDFRNGDYYAAGYGVGGLGVDITLAGLTATIGGAAGAAARAGRIATTINKAGPPRKLPGACSFAATTPVLMANGTTRPISEVQPGDHVATTDPRTGQTETKPVTAVWVHDDTLVELTLDTGDITTTEDHPFWNATDHQWQQAQHLDPGDHLLTPNGTTTTTALGVDPDTAHTAPAHNLTTADTHTYYVLAGTTPVLVHNTGPGCGAFSGRLDNIATHVTEGDLDAAARELRGEVVARKPDGTPWNHVHEVRDAQNGAYGHHF